MNKLSKFTLLFLLSMLVGYASGQTITINATITDSDNFAWKTAGVTVTFVPNPSFPNLNQYTLNGQSLATYQPYNSLLNQTLITDSSGSFTGLVLLDNTAIQPAGSTWKFIIQSDTSAQATSYPPLQLNSGNTNLTVFLSSNAIAPRFPAIMGAFGYGDVELTTTPNPGGLYYNTTTLITRQWNGTTWSNLSGGSQPATINGQNSPFTFGGSGFTNPSTSVFNFNGSSSGGFQLNNAEMGAYSSSTQLLTHTNHYVVPTGLSKTAINSLLNTAPNAVWDFQRGDTVPQVFTPSINANALQQLVKHEGLPFYTYELNSDDAGIAFDARQVSVNFTSSSKTITANFNTMTSLDIGKLMWIYNAATQQVFESQILTIPTSSTFTVATFPPWTQSVPFNSWVGTDNTSNMQSWLNLGAAQIGNGAFPTPAMKITMAAGSAMVHTLNPAGAGFEGAGPIVTNFIGAPCEDVFAAPDAFSTQTNQGGPNIGNFGVIVEGGCNATQAWTLTNDSGTSSKTAFYRPAYVKTKIANDPLGYEWCQGPAQNNIGCISTVALTNGTTLACFPSALQSTQVPAVGQAILFPYATGGLIETTVSSTAGSCSGGAAARTLGASIPAATQSFAVFGTSFQNTAADFPASRTYPYTLNQTKPIKPGPGSEYGFASTGLIQIGNEQCVYFGYSYITPSITISSCTGTSVDHASGSFEFPLNPIKPTTPYPVTPTINSGDTTPTTASFYPGRNIGNCAWAFPMSNGSSNQAQAWSGAHIHDIDITQNNIPNFNNTCGFYFVGLAYASHFTDILMNGTQFGIVQALPSTQNHNFITQQPTGDSTVWDRITIRVGDIGDIINANQNQFSNFDTYSQLGALSGGSVGCSTGLYASFGWDDQTGAQAGGMTTSKVTNFYTEPESGSNCGTAFLFDLQGYNNIFDDFHMGGSGLVAINGVDQNFSYGNLNNISLTAGNAAPVINYGNGTSFFHTESIGQSPFCNTFNFNIVTNDCSFINWGPRTHIIAHIDGTGPIGSVAYGNSRATADGQTNETFQYGNTGPDFFTHSGWGLIDPAEFASGTFDPSPMNHNLWTFDSTAYVTQANVGCNLGTNTSFVYCNPFRFNNSSIYIGQGQRLAAGKYLVYFNIKDATASTNTVTVGLSATNVATNTTTQIISPQALAVTNSYPASSATVPSFVADLSSFAGQILSIQFYGASSADVLYVQYIDFAPLPDNFNAQQLTIQGSGNPTYTNGSNGTEVWANAAPSTGCGSTYPNASIWHNSAGSHGASTLTYVCNAATTSWVGVF